MILMQKIPFLLTLFSNVHFAGSLIDLGEFNCTSTPVRCPQNETCKGHCRDPCLNNEKTIWGTGFYPYISPICKSAAHDFRISLWNESDRTIFLKRSEEKAVFHGSIHAGILSASYSFTPAKLSSYQFLSPFISEALLDTASIHRGYLFLEDEFHEQECYVSSKNLQINFNTYKGKNSNGMLISSKAATGNLSSITILWAKQNVSQPFISKKINAGFLCIPINNSLSIVTSIAFAKDAYFFPRNLTISVSINDNVTLGMFEQEDHDYETIWRKDGWKLKYMTPISINRTSITFANIEMGYSGIYSLEYKNFDVTRRGYVRLIVRACPVEKYGNQCTKHCPKCLNGGVCHDITGICICAPGFNGTVCEKVCRAGYFGRNCSLSCSQSLELDENACQELLICLPDPYGCSCGAGFSGISCNKKCLPGTYGAGCSQQRNCHCANNENCNPFSGFCHGKCDYGWHGEDCNELLMIVTNLSFELLSPTALNLTWDHATESTHALKYFIITYKQVEWRYKCNFTINDGIFKKNATQYFIVLENLEPFSVYTINVSAVTSISGPSYQLAVETSATVPPPPTNVQVHKASTSLYLRWNAPMSPYGLLDYYQISYRSTEDQNFTRVKITFSERNCNKQNDSFCYVINNLNVEEKYEIQLRTFNLNVEKGSEPATIMIETLHSKPETPVLISVLKQEHSEVEIHISSNKKIADFKRKYFIIVTSEKQLPLGAFQYDHQEPNCSYITSSGPQTYIVAMLHDIPYEGINFIIGDNSCLHGYLNPPLNIKKTYRFGVVSVLIDCEGIVYGPILYSNQLVTNSYPKSDDSSRALSISLGFFLPLAIGIGAFLIYLYRSKSFKFSWKIKFIPSKVAVESEFAACNEALDELDMDSESICEDLSNYITVEELNNFVKISAKSTKLKMEFLSVPRGQLYSCSASKVLENKLKNRYGNILTYDHSRVVLISLDGSTYIHANYVHGYVKKREFIATQGPMPHTVVDFWKLVWQEKSTKIIMMTNTIENGKSKCEKYWTEERATFDDIELLHVLSESFADFIIRTFQISKADEKRELKQFHFTSWPDHGIPPNTTPFLNFLQKVRMYNPNCYTPVIAHCSAGIGRTGAVILFENVFNMGHKEGKVDVLGQLFNMRKQRMNIVENYDQYSFVYHALVEALCIGNTSVLRNIFLTEYPELLKPSDATGITTVDKQFKMLNDLPLHITHKDIVTAYMVCNQSKNRSMHILPSERARYKLQKQWNDSDYINAVYVDGYTKKNKLIATQHPLPETLTDFWRMVYELNSRIIVVLQDIPLSDGKNPELCPQGGDQRFEDFYVTCESMDKMNDITIFNVEVKEAIKASSSMTVKIVKMKTWCTVSHLPSDVSQLLSLVELIESFEDFENCITVTCLDGVCACGVFCAFINITERIKCDKEVDIFRDVKCVRTNRPQFIGNLEQYRLLYKLTQAYLEKLDF